MMYETIGYRTRLVSSDMKVCGGSFNGRIDQDTVERLTSMFDVVVPALGTARFVDREGRQVRLYISVDPEKTEKGRKALAEYRLERDAAVRRGEELREAQQEQIKNLMAGLSHEEIVRRLQAVNEQ